MKQAIGVFVLVLFQIPLLICQQLDFSIESPNHGDIFLIKPTESTLDLTIKYSFGDNAKSISNICFKINSDVDTSIEILKETCFPQGTESVTFTNVKPDKYHLYAVTSGHTKNEVGPIIEKSFEVKSMLDLIPKLKITNDQFVFLCDEGQDETIVNINYNITENIMPIENFLICGQLLLMPDSVNMTKIRCFETTQSVLSMALKPNYYQLQLFYQDKLTQTYLQPEKTLITFEVGTFQKYLPIFKVSQYSHELVINPTTQTADLFFPYSFQNPNNIDQDSNLYDKVDICIEIIDIITSKLFVSLSCVVPSINNKILSLQGIPQGQYKANLILRNHQNPVIIYSSSLQVIEIEAQSTTEFLPTFEWQKLKKWHTIPIGLETRLPLSTAGGQKEARIPPLWRTQISLPNICHTNNGLYFLRVQLERNTALNSIRELAALSCKLPVSCILMTLDGMSVPFNEEIINVEQQNVVDTNEQQEQKESNNRKYTVESTGMFNRKVVIGIDTELGEVCTTPVIETSSVTAAVVEETESNVATSSTDVTESIPSEITTTADAASKT